MPISISAVRLFKSCRRAYWLKYIEGLEPVQRAESLESGISYHERLDEFYRTGVMNVDDSKESAMAEAYIKYIAPKLDMTVTEEWIRRDCFIGRCDGMTADGSLVEHKTTSGSIGEDYEYGLQWDEQLLMYMWLTGKRSIYYTLIRKPTIRMRRGETEQEFHDRCLAWYDEDTESKIRVIHITRTDEEVEQFADELYSMKDEMDGTSHYYRNPGWCMRWGRMCEYASVCLNYDPNEEYVEFTKRERGEEKNAGAEI